RAHWPPLRAAGDGAVQDPRDGPGLVRRLQRARGRRRARRRPPQGAIPLPGRPVVSHAADLYQELILDHGRRPRNHRALPAGSRSAEGHNPLCGDRVTVYLTLDGDTVREATFVGSGCAISQASCSLMTEAVKGKSLADVEKTFGVFHD